MPCALWSLFQWALALIVVPCVLWSLFIAVLTAFNLEVVDCVPEGELKDTLSSCTTWISFIRGKKVSVTTKGRVVTVGRTVPGGVAESLSKGL